MKNNMFLEATPLIFQRARELRDDMTSAEIKLWEFLRSRPSGYKFRRQHPIGPFIADFYCHTLQLVIEVDGSIHDQPEIKQSDRSKQWSPEKEKIKVIRFTNHEIENKYDEVITSINKILTRESSASPSGAGGKKDKLIPFTKIESKHEKVITSLNTILTHESSASPSGAGGKKDSS